MKTLTHFGLILLSTVILSLILSFTRFTDDTILGNFIAKLSSILSLTSFFLLSTYVLKKENPHLRKTSKISALLVGLSLLTLPFHILDWHSTLGALPDSIGSLTGVLLAILYCEMKSKRTIILWGIIVAVGVVWIYVKGLPLYYNKLNFDTYAGLVKDSRQYNVDKLLNKNGSAISLFTPPNEYIVLDCWHTRCSICYKEMPKTQILYDIYKDNPQVAIYALHARLENETYSTGAHILERNGYTIPSASIAIDDDILAQLGVKSYPTVIILNKERELIFRGNVEYAMKYLSQTFRSK